MRKELTFNSRSKDSDLCLNGLFFTCKCFLPLGPMWLQRQQWLSRRVTSYSGEIFVCLGSLV